MAHTSVTKMLQWTADWPSANLDSKLPVLDLSIWCQDTLQGTVTLYQFYSKPTTNPVSILGSKGATSRIGLYCLFPLLRNLDLPT